MVLAESEGISSRVCGDRAGVGAVDTRGVAMILLRCLCYVGGLKADRSRVDDMGDPYVDMGMWCLVGRRVHLALNSLFFSTVVTQLCASLRHLVRRGMVPNPGSLFGGP
jgi:hypothetical protein